MIDMGTIWLNLGAMPEILWMWNFIHWSKKNPSIWQFDHFSKWISYEMYCILLRLLRFVYYSRNGQEIRWAGYWIRNVDFILKKNMIWNDWYAIVQSSFAISNPIGHISLIKSEKGETICNQIKILSSALVKTLVMIFDDLFGNCCKLKSVQTIIILNYRWFL